MAQDEFAIIRQYFSAIGEPGADIVLGVGDDAAVIEVPAGFQQVVSLDTLIADVHFPADTNPADVAYKALAVNVSDIAAMAATPSWFLLSISLPRVDTTWLEQFSEGLKQAAEQFGLALIGGDTCRGALSISLQIAGLVPAGEFVSRGGAKPGDLVLVSGTLGNAALGLAFRQGRIDLPQELRRTRRADQGTKIRYHAGTTDLLQHSEGFAADRFPVVVQQGSHLGHIVAGARQCQGLECVQHLLLLDGFEITALLCHESVSAQ